MLVILNYYFAFVLSVIVVSHLFTVLPCILTVLTAHV